MRRFLSLGFLMAFFTAQVALSQGAANTVSKPRDTPRSRAGDACSNVGSYKSMHKDKCNYRYESHTWDTAARKCLCTMALVNEPGTGNGCSKCSQETKDGNPVEIHVSVVPCARSHVYEPKAKNNPECEEMCKKDPQIEHEAACCKPRASSTGPGNTQPSTK